MSKKLTGASLEKFHTGLNAFLASLDNLAAAAEYYGERKEIPVDFAGHLKGLCGCMAIGIAEIVEAATGEDTTAIRNQAREDMSIAEASLEARQEPLQ